MMLNKLSLNTIGLNRIGLNRIGKPSRGSSDRPYIDPEVLASLKAVCICYGKSNDDPDRAIVKNLVDPDNPFIISNAAFKLNSGFGKYETDLSDTRIWTQSKNVTSSPFNSSYNGLSGWIIFANTELTNSADMPSFKIQVKGLLEGQELIYRYYDSAGQSNVYSMAKDGEYTLPADIRTAKPLVSNTSGFQVVKNETNTITITQIPSYQGAFVTDGINDLITSTKTVQEMLGGSNEITIVSMVHQVKDTANNVSFTNYIRGSANGYFRNIVNNYGKTGIYGYTSSDLRSLSVINNILGDKNDYTSNGDNRDTIINGNFSVQGYSYNNSSNTGDFSSVAWYWTVIANKVLTTDQINQVIAYFNLDRCVEPTVWYDVQKQGLSNDTPAADWYLKDFSKNGFDMSLFNFAKDGDSGIGKYNYPNWKINVTQGNKYARIVYYDSINGTYSANFKGVTGLYKSYGLSIEIRVNRVNTVNFHSIKEDGIYTVTPPDDTTSIDIRFSGDNVYNASCDITITQIPSHAGALCFDGVTDYGQFVGNLGLKDYTIAVDRAYDELNDPQVSVIANLIATADCPFVFDFINNTEAKAISFGNNQNVVTDVFSKDRRIAYQSTYTYNGKGISKGNSTNTGTGLIAGRYGNNFGYYSKLVLYSLLLFPYSMSEFLIERQLKKRKAGTLYPDMVEFRPIVKSNVEYQVVDFYIDTLPAVVGNYYPINSKLRIAITIKGAVDEVTSLKVNGVDFGTPSINGNRFSFHGTLSDKSPQKIDITIYQPPQYLTMLSNSTLISNETLIKNE